MPIVINGVMYATSGPRVVALDADTGQEVWSFTIPPPPVPAASCSDDGGSGRTAAGGGRIAGRTGRGAWRTGGGAG